MSLLDGLTNERAKALLAELSLNQLTGLLMVKAQVEGQRVTVRVRPLESRVKVKKGRARVAV